MRLSINHLKDVLMNLQMFISMFILVSILTYCSLVFYNLFLFYNFFLLVAKMFLNLRRLRIMLVPILLLTIEGFAFEDDFVSIRAAFICSNRKLDHIIFLLYTTNNR